MEYFRSDFERLINIINDLKKLLDFCDAVADFFIVFFGSKKNENT